MQRRILSWVSGWKCAICGDALKPSFHADHVVPFSRGGRTNTNNGQALCARCNQIKGANMTQLRAWQQDALNKAIKWLVTDRSDRHFLINAAPGAGKTIAACVIAKRLLDLGEVDRVIVIAPRSEVVNQWADDFRVVTGRHMTKVTARAGDVNALGIDVCATWSAVQGLQDALQAVCRANRVLVICDEHHHAAVKAAWGAGADDAFAAAKFALILSGTPIRSDGEQSVWLAYDDGGSIDHPEAGTYTLSYGEAVDLGYCRPAAFHLHEGKFTVDLQGGKTVQISSDQEASLPKDLARIPGLQRALNFYKLACTPQYEADKVTPLRTGYQATMVEWGGAKLTELRLRMPNAGGLVIAQSIEMAEYMVNLIELLEGERPLLVHSQNPNADGTIKAFRNTDKRWLVSVAMVSEGVDIPRLRVLVYLPNALTELSFRQAVGRVVRSCGHDDDTRAYVVMPAFSTFEAYARRIEDEMSPAAKTGGGGAPKLKRCPICATECELHASQCPSCGHEFPAAPQRFKTCDDCGALNSMTADQCHACGKSFATSFILTLDEALRNGAIVRGLELEEAEVKEGETIAPAVRARALQVGDQNLVRILRTLPDESWGRLKAILTDSPAGTSV